MKINIFATAINVEVVRKSISQIEQIFNLKNLSINVPDSDLDLYRNNFYNINFIPDSTLLDYRLLKKLENSSRPGWNKQQVLKLLQVSANQEDTLIIDGDTILRTSLLQEILMQRVLYTTKENVDHYNLLLERILNFQLSDKSYITNFGVFSPRDYASIGMECFIEQLINGETTSMPISEYQLNGNLRRFNVNSQRPLRIFRRADLLSLSTEKILNSYECVCYESRHKTNFFRVFLAHIAFLIGYSW